ncbi:MAG: TrkH family potassium uptake protein [Alphaproteobacteria bacterium]|jgi:trk system potassium uptake protein TrkH|nr:TrkH family potassium uptake protein [Alphaproteobacteria bacterium]
MNYRLVINQLGLLLVGMSVLLAAIGAWAALEWWLGDGAEQAAFAALLLSAAAGGAAGGLMWALTRGEPQLGRREALLLVATAWLIGAAVAGLPFQIWATMQPAGPDHAFASPVNCYFEAMSGLTTTGATILDDIPAVPRSLLLWRSMTHWLGGLGIVVLFVAVLPGLGAGGKRLFKVEAPGPRAEGVRPHIRETALYLWMLYVGLTLAEIAALRLAGVGWYESVSHTFATLATGGFSTHNASIGTYDSVAVDVIVMVFMFAAGINFGLYHQMLRGRTKLALRDTELQVYAVLTLLGILLVTASIYGTTITTTGGRSVEAGLGEALRYGAFQHVAIQTTTGFCTADFNAWPFLAKAVLVVSMFIGGSAGSTAGGIKVIRIWIMAKVLLAEVDKAFRPNVVRPIRVGRFVVDDELRTATVSYVLWFVMLIFAGAGLVMLLERGAAHELGFASAATASIASIFNIGPGLERVGATQNYAWLTDGSKLVLTILMAAGRLELFAIAVLFTPRFWRNA